MKCFYNGKEITQDEAEYLEQFTAARVIRGASGSVPARLGGGNDSWIELEDR